jgi:uncharacterized membrane protein
MPEITQGVFNLIKNLLNKGSFTLACLYTVGHVIIAITVVRILTGASWWDAGAVAMLEPFINGIWFYVLHKIWKKFNNLNE